MTKKISDSQLLRLRDFVAGRIGLHFPPERWLDLQRAVCSAAQECGCQSALDRYVEELLSPTLTPKELQGLATHLTVGETYFFREKRSLEVFEKHIVPELVRTHAGRVIGIWSAGCATGEEPYSIAIMLCKLMAGLEKSDVKILATDLNSRSLQKAAEGIYGEWSFRGVPPSVRSAYFDAVEKDRWALSPAIKKMVSFAQLNLMDGSLPPLWNSTIGFDVIFCRNVLMYFAPEGMRKVIRQLYLSLASDGWLIVSPTETSQELFSEFAAVTFGDVTLYRKSPIHSSVTLAMPGLEQNRLGVQLTARIMPAPEPAHILPRRSSQEAEDHPARSENTAQPAVSYEQALRLYGQGRYLDLERVIVALSSQDGNHASALLLLAQSYANQGNLAAALLWCDKAIAADKMAARAYYLRATILQEQGSLPAALFAFQQTVYAEPQFVLGHFSLGNLALNHGRLKDSQKHFENVLLLLAQYRADDIVPESEGLSAGRLREMIASRRGGAALLIPPSAPEAGLSPPPVRRPAKAGVEQGESLR